MTQRLGQKATENGQEIYKVECKESLMVRITEGCFKRTGEEYIPFIGSTGGWWDRGGTERAKDFTHFCGKGNSSISVRIYCT